MIKPPSLDGKDLDKGFTLIELSIVLVIIGLIAGGVLTGQELIHAARIRQMGTELQKIEVAINAFRIKYDCLPGDCANATAFFGVNSAGCPNGGGATGTCNGNGDGFINGVYFNGNLENIYVWQHLSMANLIPWSFAGSAMTGGTTFTPLVIGTNIPASTLNPAIGYNFFSARISESTYPKKTIEVGALSALYQDQLCGAGLTAPQARSLDLKFDDGLPQSGKIFAVRGGSSLPGYNGVNGVFASAFNSNTTCVASGQYLFSSSSGCEMEYAPSVP
jgi:prepilin-type N-terminal cleavage/methylation domain-containing protein